MSMHMAPIGQNLTARTFAEPAEYVANLRNVGRLTADEYDTYQIITGTLADVDRFVVMPLHQMIATRCGFTIDIDANGIVRNVTTVDARLTAARTLLADVESAIAELGADVTQSTLDDLAVVRAAMQWPTFDDDECSSFLLGMLDDIA